MDERSIKGWDHAMSTISLKGVIDEDFVNYKVPSMTLMFPYCNFKCEVNGAICQNSDLASSPIKRIEMSSICERYIKNNITRAIICQGLEPMDSFEELLEFIAMLRNTYSCNDDVVIFTGYNEEEIPDKVKALSGYENIIVKFGRYLPGYQPHFDSVLGIKLISNNQYARCL